MPGHRRHRCCRQAIERANQLNNSGADGGLAVEAFLASLGIRGARGRSSWRSTGYILYGYNNQRRLASLTQVLNSAKWLVPVQVSIKNLRSRSPMGEVFTRDGEVKSARVNVSHRALRKRRWRSN
jgi:hypothetical protein